jgi:hypothetical protein
LIRYFGEWENGKISINDDFPCKRRGTAVLITPSSTAVCWNLGEKPHYFDKKCKNWENLKMPQIRYFEENSIFLQKNNRKMGEKILKK